MKTIDGTFRGAVAAALLAGAVAGADDAAAAVVITLSDDGSDLTATATGSLDLAGLGPGLLAGGTANGILARFTAPDTHIVELGSGPGTLVGWYTVSPPFEIYALTSFAAPQASSSSGTQIAIWGLNTGGGANAVFVSESYVSGTPFATSSTWSGLTVAGFGLIPGQYVNTLSNGETVTLEIRSGPAQPVPLPAALPLLLAGLGALGLARRYGGRARG